MRRSGCSTAPSTATCFVCSRLSGAIAVFLSTLACLAGPTASGQESPSAAASTAARSGAGLDALPLSQAILGGLRQGSRQPADAAPGNTVATAPADTASAAIDRIDAALGYLPDPAISAEIRQHEIDAGAVQDPAWRPVLEKAFADGAALQQFQALLAARGYSSGNVADAVAGLMWTSWQFVNDAALTDTQIRGVHRQIRAIFLASPNLPSLTDETRQRLSENAAYRVMIATAAMRTDDPALLAKSRQNIAVIVRNIVDLDLAKLDVTPDGGFSAREAAVP